MQQEQKSSGGSTTALPVQKLQHLILLGAGPSVSAVLHK